MDITEGRLSIIIRSPLFQAELGKLERDVYDKAVDVIGDISGRVQKLQPQALDTIEELMREAKQQRLRRDCAKDVLEMGGLLRKQKDVEGMNDFAQMVTSAFQLAAASAQARREVPVVVVDVEACEAEAKSMDVEATATRTSDAPVGDVQRASSTSRELEAEDVRVVSTASIATEYDIQKWSRRASHIVGNHSRDTTTARSEEDTKEKGTIRDIIDSMFPPGTK